MSGEIESKSHKLEVQLHTRHESNSQIFPFCWPLEFTYGACSSVLNYAGRAIMLDIFFNAPAILFSGTKVLF